MQYNDDFPHVKKRFDPGQNCIKKKLKRFRVSLLSFAVAIGPFFFLEAKMLKSTINPALGQSSPLPAEDTT